MTCPKGKGGPKPGTLREKQILGVRSKERMNRNPPTVIKDRVAKIGNLGEIGEHIFKLYEPMLYNNGTLSATDAITLQMLCKKYEDWIDLTKKVEQEGKFIPGKIITINNGKKTTTTENAPTISPWAKLEKEAFNDLLKLCREFGLTPVSRSGVDRISRGEKIKQW